MDKLTGTPTEQITLHLVTELAENGSLRDLLNDPSFWPRSISSVAHIATEIARGMRYIHSKRFVHRDLKPDNILVRSPFFIFSSFFLHLFIFFSQPKN